MPNRDKRGYALFLVNLLRIEGDANSTPYNAGRYIETRLLKESDLDLIDDFISSFTKENDSRVKEILFRRYHLRNFESKTMCGGQQSYREIGKSLPKPITGSRVSEIHKRTLRMMRHPSRLTTILPVLEKIAVAGLKSSCIEAALENAALKQLLKKQAFRRTFLVDCLPDCNQDNPCPTCQAKKLLAEKERIERELLSLELKWGGDDGDWRSYPLENVAFTVRTARCLKNESIHTLGQLCEQTERELMQTPYFGRKSLNEVKCYLTSIGKKLRK